MRGSYGEKREQGDRSPNIRSRHTPTADITAETSYRHVRKPRPIPHAVNYTERILLALDGHGSFHILRQVREETSRDKKENESDAAIPGHMVQVMHLPGALWSLNDNQSRQEYDTYW